MFSDITRDWWRSPIIADQQRSNSSASSFPASADGTLPFAAVIAFTVILLLAPQQIFPFLEPFRIAMLAVAVAVSSHTFSRLNQRKTAIELNQGVIFAALLAGWAVLTVPLSFWPGGSVTFLLGMYFKALLVFFLLANVVNSIARLRIISGVLVVIAVPLAMTTLNNYATGALLSGGQRVVGYDSPLAENPNDLALMLNLILPFAIAHLIGNSKPFVRLLLGATIFLMAAAIIATFSRAGFLTLGVIFLVYAWRLRTRPQWMLAPLVLVLALASLPFLPDSYIERIETITNIEEDESGSAQTRWSDTIDAVRLFVRQPFVGAGVGMNIFAMNEARGETWTQIHNVYLSLGLELGLPGLLLYLALYRYCLICTGRPSSQLPIPESTALSENNPAHKNVKDMLLLGEGVKVSLIAFGFAALFHPVAYHFYFYYIAGLAVAIGSISNQIEASSPPVAR